MANPSIGIIGMGLMGRMYAKRFSEAGYSVNVCDRPDRYEELRAEYADKVSSSHLVEDRIDILSKT
ncbi:prephenate dehydrogenase (NADP(+)) [Lithohypha guttulata]|uniref:Prephenate dehydrogenase (NADP(+)) n=1 Tax=Lithohypha guttulata TaxID=1690604 RepID=A0AAN7SV75_9EURO|nr:prephenate dehydrogenase (NADP(+)) [Lithohypha guttulata]KAK5081592.1 prephenate dehydrogenase (NADP(+)) [Lithohypha guttulata]